MRASVLVFLHSSLRDSRSLIEDVVRFPCTTLPFFWSCSCLGCAGCGYVLNNGYLRYLIRAGGLNIFPKVPRLITANALTYLSYSHGGVQYRLLWSPRAGIVIVRTAVASAPSGWIRSRFPTNWLSSAAPCRTQNLQSMSHDLALSASPRCLPPRESIPAASPLLAVLRVWSTVNGEDFERCGEDPRRDW